VLLKVNFEEIKTTRFESKPFLAHQLGYWARVIVDFSYETKPDHFLVYLDLCPGYRIDLTWPFRIRHKITLVDQQDNGSNIQQTIEPDGFSEGVKSARFGDPRKKKRTAVVEGTMLCVPLETLFTQSYTKNNTIIIKVEIDN
jgi:hypothetical protein